MVIDICASYLQRFSLFVYVLGEWWLCIDVLNTMDVFAVNDPTYGNCSILRNRILISDIQTLNNTQSTDINNIKTLNTTQDGRLTTIESLNTTQSTDIINIKTLNTTQDGRLTAIEGLNVTQSTDIINIKTLNTTQDGRLTTIESLNTTQSTDITRLKIGSMSYGTLSSNGANSPANLCFTLYPTQTNTSTLLSDTVVGYTTGRGIRAFNPGIYKLTVTLQQIANAPGFTINSDVEHFIRINKLADTTSFSPISMAYIFDIKMNGNCANDTYYGSKNEWNMIVYHPTDNNDWRAKYRVNYNGSGDARPHLFSFEITFKQTSTLAYYIQLNSGRAHELSPNCKWMLSYLGPP
jgi:hypothetical protein